MANISEEINLKEEIERQRELNKNLLMRIVQLEAIQKMHTDDLKEITDSLENITNIFQSIDRRIDNLIISHDAHINSTNTKFEDINKRFKRHINDYDMHKE